MDKATIKAWKDMVPTLVMATIVFLAFWFSYEGTFTAAMSGDVGAGFLGLVRATSANFMLLLGILIAVWTLPSRLAKAMK